MTRLAVYGGSFNPPGVHHLKVVQRLREVFDRVVVVPCGPRPDKPVTNDVSPVHRAAMTDLTFGHLPGVEVDLFDLEAATFTRTWELEQRYRGAGEVWHVVGTDLVARGAAGESDIQRTWYRGAQLWDAARFAVVERAGYDAAPGDLPPHHQRLAEAAPGASRDIRERAFRHEPLGDLVVDTVAAYIDRYRLYRGTPPLRNSQLVLPHPRPLVLADEGNGRAEEIAARVRVRYGVTERTPSSPDLIIVVGGDGTMLRAIRTHWRKRLPFYGVNAGHLGFLLNPTLPDEAPEPPRRAEPLKLTHVPLLWVETERADGSRHQSLAFNDAWVERSSGQTAWLTVHVDGRERLRRLVADGALVATAAGSTSYARAMGAAPLPLDTPALLLVGSNVLRPLQWRPAVLPLESEVELRTLDAEKRPLEGYVDGVSQGPVHALKARVSHIAAVELAFAPAYHPAEKLARIQFPLDPPEDPEPGSERR